MTEKENKRQRKEQEMQEEYLRRGEVLEEHYSGQSKEADEALAEANSRMKQNMKGAFDATGLWKKAGAFEDQNEIKGYRSVLLDLVKLGIIKLAK